MAHRSIDAIKQVADTKVDVMIESTYTLTVTVQRATTSNPDGTFTETWADHLTGVMMHRRQLSANEALKNDSDQVIADWRFYCEPDQDIIESDRLVYDGQFFNIKRIDPCHDLSHHWQIDAIRDDKQRSLES